MCACIYAFKRARACMHACFKSVHAFIYAPACTHSYIFSRRDYDFKADNPRSLAPPRLIVSGGTAL